MQFVSCVQDNIEFAGMRKRFEQETRSVGVNALTEVKRLIANGQEEAFVVVDTAVAQGQVERWNRNLPRVSPWYAIKCHPDRRLMEALFAKGCGFDAASIAEIKLALETGARPEQIIFANPCKMASHIRFAESVGVDMMTFDNVDELRKIKLYHPRARLVMRILGDDSSSLCKFNAKFGVAVDQCLPLVREAKRLGCEIIGVSFHVGSGCRSADAFVGAVVNARRAFDILESVGFHVFLLDLGGGWPGSLAGDEEPGEIGFEDICGKVRPALNELFPSANLKIIAEPGRYFAHASAVAVCNVTSKRVVYAETPKLIGNISDSESDNEHEHDSCIKGFRYYVNDGVYGTFNGVICDHRDRLEPYMVFDAEGRYVDISMSPSYESSIWGNTCDGMDKISASVMLPDLPVGSWLLFANMGAYSVSAASCGFNGFPLTKKYYV